MRIAAFLRGLIVLLALAASVPAFAEDGYDLWLRYRPVEEAARVRYQPAATALVSGAATPTLDAAQAELLRGLTGLLGSAPYVSPSVRDGAVVFGTPKSSPIIAGLKLPLERAGDEGYLIRSVRIDGARATVIAANSDIGVL